MLATEVERDPDASLVEAFQAGDASAFDALVARYKRPVYGVAYRLAGNAADAEDIAQEAFIRVYRSLPGFRGDARFKTWLFTITTNVARNRMRDGQRKGRNKIESLDARREALGNAHEPSDHSTPNPNEAARTKEMESLLQGALDELPEHYRTVFVLRIQENLSYDEIAEAVGCPKGTVKSRLNQARSLLHRRLSELGAL